MIETKTEGKPKTQRIRDPIHGLIVFRAEDETDQLAWRLINTPEFQRLRRVRQLGFSDFVYPGATHSRFAHSLGAFQTARKLVEVIRRKLDKQDERRQRVALLGALLHDIGHGPFSHAFDAATKKVGFFRKHEDWGADMIQGDTAINQKLTAVDPSLPNEIATLLREEEPKDIYATVVTSQFDADRLDYLRRDRFMTGVAFGQIDVDWLFDCLEVDEITTGDLSDPVRANCLCLNTKGFRVAEEYLEAKYRLYIMVYMHKTTRAAEKMFTALIARFAELVRPDAGGIPDSVRHGRLANFFRTETP